MSYIINNSDAYVNVKLTEKGREKLAKGALNFSFWAIGDSEINYIREEVVDTNPTDVTLSAITKIMRPKDRQPNIKSWIYSSTSGDTINPLNQLTTSNIKTLKVVVNNEAEERGFFSGDSINGWTTITGSPYTVSSGFISDNEISGGTSLVIGTGTSRNVGDYILLKLTNPTLGTITPNSNDEPIPHLWYKIQSTSGDTIYLDRNLPNLSIYSGSSIQYIIYPGGELEETIGASNTTSYWDSGTLSFNSACDISCEDVPVWNMNNVWCEDLAGITADTWEGHEYFGSYQYLGSKYPYFEYDCETSGVTNDIKCEGISQLDLTNKSVAIIHYTNNAISNFYGEFFYIDLDTGKTLKLHIPDIMYHRRYFSGGTGDTMGMSFQASGSVKTIGTSDIEYYNLYEDYNFIKSGETPQIVGKVFPQLKMVVIDDEEIVAALSYKSNRNWTLPPLAANLVNPSGTTSGLLLQNETMYLTWGLENDTGSGLTTSLACQKYTKITNQTATSKDVEFRIDGVGLLPYMRKIESGWDGRGFYGYRFKVMYQIVNNDTDRPDPSAWKVYDFTNNNLTGVSGETIDPNVLESQLPSTNGFLLDNIKDSGSTQYDITNKLSMPTLLQPEILQFGDERFFYGNIETFIGATIYKTIFDIRVNANQFTETTNKTRSKDPSTNPPNIRISEVGIYDSDNELIAIGKMSQPIKLEGGNTIMIELSMDF